jgi:hypothetical protein
LRNGITKNNKNSFTDGGRGVVGIEKVCEELNEIEDITKCKKLEMKEDFSWEYRLLWKNGQQV